MLIHEIDNIALRFDRPTRLPAWVGTELRGMVKEHFKRWVCCHPELDGLSDDERTDDNCQAIALPECSTCPAELREECYYALAFEPGAMNSDLRTGEEPARPLVLAPAFPTPERIAAGDALDFRVLLIGRAIEAVHPLLEAIAIAGWERGLGPTKSRVPVLLENLHLARHRQHRLDLASLPAGTARDAWGAGRLILSDVPRSLLPWLEWGGRLHVGNRRSAGAGSWRLLL